MPDNKNEHHATKQWGWGIVGSGNIARKFAEDLKYVPGAAKRAVYSRTAKTGAAFAAQFKFEKSYTDLSEFLAADDIDIVYIATPHIAHLDQAIAAIKVGKAVLIEKPITMTGDEARQIEKAAAEHQVLAMEALWSRFLPTVQRAKAIISSGQLGTIMRAEASLNYFRAFDANDRLFNPALGGGVMHDLGVYPISVASYLLGEATLKNSAWRPAPNGVNTQADIELECGGTPVSINISFDGEGENSFIVYGTKGTLRIERHFLKSDTITVWDEAKSSLPNASGGIKNKIFNRLGFSGGKKEHFPLVGTGLHYQASAVQAALGQGLISHPVMPLSGSAKVLDIIEQVLSQPPSN